MHLSKASFLKSFVIIAFVFSILSFFSFKEVKSELIYNGQFPGVQVSPSTGNPCGELNSDGMTNFDSASMEACEQGGGNIGREYYPPQPPEPPIVAPAASDSVTVYVVPEGENPENGTKGLITAEKDSCIIEDGQNTCDVKFTWSVTNPDPEKVATVKREPIAGPVINQNSGSQILPVYYWLDSIFDTNRYVLFIDKVYTKTYDGVKTVENGKILSQAFVKATCKDGSSWVPSLNQCVKNASVKKFSTPNCTIPVGSGSCNSEISWEAIGGHGDFSVTTPTNITVATGKSGTKSYAVQYPSRDFYLYNNGKELAKSTSYADCVSGSTWSSIENKCVVAIIPHECPAGTAWNELSQTCLCNNGATNPPTCTIIPPPQTCNNGATNPPECTIIPPQTCDNGATNPPECSLFGALSKFEVKDCSIKSNESTCQTKLNWISTLLGSFAITTPEQITVSTASSGTDVPYTVEYPSRKFFAYNNGNLVEEKTSFAKCEEGSVWHTIENKCVPGMLCAGDLERDVYFDCPPGYEGKIIRKQFKTFPECVFPEPVTEENTVLVNNNCRSKDGPDSQWTGRSCGECSEGVEQVYCTETNENGDVREFIMNCPGDIGGGGSGQSVLNIEIKATPDKIMKGRLSTITWSSNADSCKSVTIPGNLNDFQTNSRPNGFDTVKPISNNVYEIECTKGEITESKRIEVKVSSLNIIEL